MYNLFKKEKPVRYLVSYFYEKKDGSGFGNAQVTYPRRIRNIEDIQIIEREIKRDIKFESVNAFILNYKELEGKQ